MVMTPEQIAAELQRKKNAGDQPSNPANLAQYNQLTKTQPTFSAYGGKDNYVSSQNDRWQQANANNDTGLMSRLIADSNRAGYTLNPYNNQTMNGQNKSADLFAQLEQALNKPFDIPSFSFDAQNDPRFQQAMQLADQAAVQGTGNVLANLASRGIENGSIMGDRAQQIQQQERGKVTGQLLPQMYAQAYDQYANELNMKYRANQDQLSGLANLLGIQNTQNQQGLDNTFRDKSFDWMKSTDTANFTGTFNGQRTLAGQSQDFNQGVTMASITGMMPDGSKTTAEQQRQLENEWVLADQTGEITSTLSKLYGIPEGTPTRAAKEFAQQLAISQQNANRLSSGGGSGGGNTPKPANLNKAIENINKMFTAYDSKSGKRVVNNPAALKSYIDSLGYSDSERQQLYSYYGVSSGNGGGGWWNTIKSVLDGVSGAASGLNSSTVSDKDIEQYLNKG